jgi:hypothetical protein
MGTKSDPKITIPTKKKVEGDERESSSPLLLPASK